MPNNKFLNFISEKFNKSSKNLILDWFYRSKNSKNFNQKKISFKVLNNVELKTDSDKINFYLLGVFLANKGNHIESYLIFRRTLKLIKNNHEILFNLGMSLVALNKFRLALKFLKFSNNVSRNFSSIFQIASIYQKIGNFEESKKNFNAIIYSNFFNDSANRLYSMIHKYKDLNDKHIIKMNEIIKNNQIQEDSKVETYFALGKAYDDLMLFDKAFEMFNKGNSLNKKRSNYSKEITEKHFLIIAKCTDSLKKKKYDFKENLKNLIFIVGMPRSGTTLLEQVLSAHSKIASYGETLIFPKMIKRFFPNMQQDLFLDEVDRIDQFKFNEVRNYLVDQYNLNNRQKDFQYYIDKLPFNYIFINFINFFLPESKIIHMNRSPKDVCLSIFNNYFTSNFLNFTNSQNDIASYYSQYMTLMECHKEKNLKFIDLNYEDFVKNISAESKRVINYLDLNYEEQQEQYYMSKNIATTLSLGQVRSKNYTTSINKWENYLPFLSESIKNI